MHCIDTGATRARSTTTAPSTSFTPIVPVVPRAPTVPARLRRGGAWLALGASCALAACAAPPTQTIADYRFHAAQRLVAANPGITYMTPAPDPLLAIPVLEIEVNADGSVRHITVLRVPTQAQDTLQIAVDAVRRAAPFGDATRLPKPWKFSEAFLFDDDRHFKPRSLD